MMGNLKITNFCEIPLFLIYKISKQYMKLCTSKGNSGHNSNCTLACGARTFIVIKKYNCNHQKMDNS
uniref:Uncharacterized protein n=1 Tax=Rhizophora mucronata TaxID=61149 RepID=A0A2P2L2Z3_RHIMU